MRNNKKNFSRGITLIALVVTIIVLLILAGISVQMLTGENGVITRAVEAKEKTEIEQEKETIALAYNSALAKKAINGDSSAVTSENLNAELTNKGASASGNNIIKVVFDSGRKYTINSNGKIEQDIKPTVETFSLTYKIVSDGLQIYPQVDDCDKLYYDALTDIFLNFAKENISSECNSILNITNYMINQYGNDGPAKASYNTLKEWYLYEYATEYNSCAEWLFDMHIFDIDTFNEMQTLLPSEYYITVSCNEETERINLVEKQYVQFEIAGGGDYLVYAVDNQKNSETNIIVTIDDLSSLKAFYIGNMYRNVGGNQRINNIYARNIYSSGIIDNNKTFEYILYNNNIYKIAYNTEPNGTGFILTDATDVSLVEVESSFAELEIETGFKILVTPSTPDNLIHSSYRGPDTYTDNDGQDFEGYCAYDNDGYLRYYNTSGTFVYMMEYML